VTRGRGRSPTAALYTRLFSLKTRKYAKIHPKHTHQHLPRAPPPCQHVPPTSPRHPVTRGRGRSPTAALYTRLFSLKTRKYAKIHPKHTHQHLPRAPPPCQHVPPTSPRHPVTRGRGRSPTAALYTRLFSLKTRKYAKIHPKHTHQHLPRAPPPCQHVPPTSPRHPVTRGRGRSPTAALYTRLFSLKTRKYAKIHPKHTHQHLPRAPPPCQHVPPTSPRHPVTRGRSRSPTAALYTRLFLLKTQQNLNFQTRPKHTRARTFPAHPYHANMFPQHPHDTQ
jgi:hypothetical protein